MPYKFNGKEFDEETGLYYYGARYMNPVASIWYGVDPLAEKYTSVSAYTYCLGNPIKLADINGCDTINVNFDSNKDKWIIGNVKLANGHDVYNISEDGTFKESLHFNSLKKGDVSFLSLDINNSYSLEVYHIHGSEAEGATGFFIAPGGEPSYIKESGTRVPNGSYPMTTPEKPTNFDNKLKDGKYLNIITTGKWRTIGLGGAVAGRGAKIHYGYPEPRIWSLACFVISSDYKKKKNHIYYEKAESINQYKAFHSILGASSFYKYKAKDVNYLRIGVIYEHPLNNTIFVGSR